MPLELGTTTLKLHDQIVLAMVKVFVSYDFNVTYGIKGITNRVKGDSGITYSPDIVARKGPVSILCKVQTSEHRRNRAKTSRGVIQIFQAELDDLMIKLKRPRGMVVSLDGMGKDAEQLARHFGIYLVHVPLEVATKIANFDPLSQREKIVEIARKIDLEF